jgi:uncharacterized protein (TIGR02302 family)
MATDTPNGMDRLTQARLKATRLATGGAMALERLWPRIVPFLVAAALFASLSWFGVFRLLPDLARQILLGIVLVCAAVSIWPLRSFRLPDAGAIDRRIERANRLEHAPLLTQSDRLAGEADDPFAAALWSEHRRRMAAKLGRLSGTMPDAGMPERDPYGIRAGAAMLALVAFAFSYGPLGGTLLDGFRAAPGIAAVPPRVDAWVTPPAYTGRAPVFMTADANRGSSLFEVPEGSTLAIRVTGGTGTETVDRLDAASGETVALGIEESPAGARASGSRQFVGTLSSDSLVTLRDGEGQVDGSELESWRFLVIEDAAPVIRFADEPRQALNGSLELAYEIEDDYGATSALASFAQADAATGARPLYEAPEMPLSLPRRARGEPSAVRSVRDLTEHPWAGTAIDLQLVATDAAGQEGRSEALRVIMPQRNFLNPLARALVEQRRLIALDANAKPRVLGLMDAITLRPEDTFDNLSHYLGVMSARSRLQQARSDDQLRDVAEYLWDMALTIEDGALSDAERRLRMAQEALQEALERGAGDEEIAQLMEELREAMRDFLREFAERAQQNPESALQMPMDGQMLSQTDLERMMDQIEELARSGARDEAQELLSQLQDMMNNLQAQQQQGQQGGQQSEMHEQMNQLGELMRRQQELMNETFRTDQMQPGQQGQQGQQGQGQQGMSPEEFAEALRQLQEGQGQVQQDLQSLMEALEGMGMQPGEGFGEAGQSMGRAGDALGEGQGQRAVGEQGQALEALRRGAQEMMQQMQQAMQGEQGGSEQGGVRQQGADRDPLGRPRATTGPDFGDTVRVPDEIDVQRARRILEAIRERLGNALSPEVERNYLERLLELQ